VQVEIEAAEAWAGAVAERWCARLRERPRLRMCCATGDTTVPLYAAMADAVAQGRASFHDAEVFLLDEYLGLPRGHRARCDETLRRDLVDRVDLPGSRFHRIEVERDEPDAAAERFDRALARGGIDLAIVGLGRNGHVALNEPGSATDSPTRVVELAEPTRAAAVRYGATDVVPTRGVTIGLGRLREAGEIWLLVTGAHKAEILARAIDAPRTVELPASLLRDHPALRVLADEPAATRLQP
jgi:glucosamine-6-phosphate deaminase